MAVTREQIEQRLQDLLEGVTKDGKLGVSVKAGGLHRLVGGYPGSDHRMPMCCSVMQAGMRSGDKVLRSPPGGRGASLEIYYKLPR